LFGSVVSGVESGEAALCLETRDTESMSEKVRLVVIMDAVVENCDHVDSKGTDVRSLDWVSVAGIVVEVALLLCKSSLKLMHCVCSFGSLSSFITLKESSLSIKWQES